MAERYSEQQPNLMKMAKDLYPAIVKQLEERGIKPQRALSDQDLSRIVDQSPSIANRLTLIENMQEGREYGDKDLMNILRLTGQEGRSVVDKDLDNLRKVIGLQEGKTFSTKDKDLINRLDQILEVGGFPSESSTQPMSRGEGMMMAELMNMQPVGSSGVEGILADVAGMTPQARMTRLLADKKLYSQMVEDSQKVLRNMFGKSNNPKLDPMDFNTRYMFDDFPVSSRSRALEQLEKYQRRTQELRNIDNQIASLEKAMGQMTTNKRNLPTDEVFESFMKKSGMRDGGIAGLLRRP